jgi:transposase
VFIKAPSGRQRFNVLGALEAHTLQLITVTNDCYINALSVCQLLLKLRLLFPDDLLTVVLDNARYQHCRLVMDVAAALEIELLFLPPYSPNLNLIERLWKFVKKECLTTQYYAAFDTFKEAITSCLAHTQDVHKDKLATLLTLNFQTFDNVIL